jgi:predicted TIM-barrel fold metal-dependent hydrolase
MHCHIGGIGAGESGCFVSEEMKRNSITYHWHLRSLGVTEQELQEKGDDLIVDRLSEMLARSEFVDKAVLLAMDGVIGDDGELDKKQTRMYVPNEFVAKAVARHNNFLFGASVNPYRKDALERLECAERNGAVLVKWLPSIMHIDPDEKCDEKKRESLILFYKKLVDLNLPLLTHTGDEQSFNHPKNELADPKKLVLPLSMGVKVIAAHCASLGKYEDDDGEDKPGIVILAK